MVYSRPIRAETVWVDAHLLRGLDDLVHGSAGLAVRDVVGNGNGEKDGLLANERELAAVTSGWVGRNGDVGMRTSGWHN